MKPVYFVVLLAPNFTRHFDHPITNTSTFSIIYTYLHHGNIKLLQHLSRPRLHSRQSRISHQRQLCADSHPFERVVPIHADLLRAESRQSARRLLVVVSSRRKLQRSGSCSELFPVPVVEGQCQFLCTQSSCTSQYSHEVCDVDGHGLLYVAGWNVVSCWIVWIIRTAILTADATHFLVLWNSNRVFCRLFQSCA